MPSIQETELIIEDLVHYLELHSFDGKVDLPDMSHVAVALDGTGTLTGLGIGSTLIKTVNNAKISTNPIAATNLLWLEESGWNIVFEGGYSVGKISTQNIIMPLNPSLFKFINSENVYVLITEIRKVLKLPLSTESKEINTMPVGWGEFA